MRISDWSSDVCSSDLERLSALARAHALTMPKDSAAGSNDSVRLHVLLRTILAPYEGAGGGDDRLRINGDDVTLPGNAMTTIALILHELATNAAKYGPFSSTSGTVHVECVAKKIERESCGERGCKYV